MSLPGVLVVSTQPWSFAARLARALGAAGFLVHGACPAGSLLARSAAPSAWHRLRHWRLAEDLAAALRQARPDLVVPCDDRSAGLLAELHAQPDLAPLIRASLGDPAAYPVLGSKSAQVALAAELGLPVPASFPVASRAELDSALAAAPPPRVLKSDGTWGGAGVAVIRRAEDAGAAWDRIMRRPGLAEAGKLALRERSLRPVMEHRRWRPTVPDLQAFVPGRAANRAVVCHEGRVLAGLSVEVLEMNYPNGPASVVRVIDRPDMARTAEAMAERLGLTGFVGFDFVIEEGGQALMIEMNPRATPICHLAARDGGVGLASALMAAAGVRPEEPALPATGEEIALFPGEWSRDPESPWLRRVRHDVPWEDPPLLRAYLADAAWIERYERMRGRVRRALHR
ncbi:ATP-grasp domain-containing protein [Muricoccus radiodurans]|uniref:ATP-grasp domain-containing protein n=1 Tax=Muricoccus radiodurans TaxID=2231721 RepID=UPI003CEE2A6F